MSLITLRQLLDHAGDMGYGVPAFNINSKVATAAAADIAKQRFEAFGCAGQACKLKPMPLEALARRYAASTAKLAA